MVSLWGSSNNDQPDDTTTNNQNQSRTAALDRDDRVEQDERAPLLSRSRDRRPPHADGFLEPDDPAVSPYNLWTVRLMRHLTVLFLTATFIWWVLLLVSIFVSPPGLATRGSGFFDFAYTTLTAGNLLVTLLFFTSPSKAMRALQGVVALLLLVNMILIVSVGRLRLEESWPGIASVVWALVMSIWCIITDRVVAWGKKEEEERLTGRAETRRTAGEWLAVLVATVILSVYLAIVLFMTATLIIRARDSSLEMPGQRIYVDDNKYQVHIACVGESGTDKLGNKIPTVLLEAGESPSEWQFAPWLHSTFENGTIGRYCYWDRPGYGWSDNAPSPLSAGMAADALSEALATVGEEGPWILVSAGYGSVVSRIFSTRNRNSISGIMLIDALHEDLLHRLARPGRGFLLWSYGIISPLGIERVLGAMFSGITREDRVFGRKAYQGGKFIKAQLQENLIADSLTKKELVAARHIQDQDTPLVVISSALSNHRDSDWERKQEDLTHLTANLLGWDIVKMAPHQVWQSLEGREIMEQRLKELIHYKKD